jgi:hypothetical protein
VRADFQAATLGNILIGGVIGVVVDAASGAMGTYPPSVAVILPSATSVAGAPPADPRLAPVVAMEPVDSRPAVRPASTAPAPMDRGPPRT